MARASSHAYAPKMLTQMLHGGQRSATSTHTQTHTHTHNKRNVPDTECSGENACALSKDYVRPTEEEEEHSHPQRVVVDRKHGCVCVCSHIVA